MKYLAILKDSLREALDSKVLYVMVAVSTLVILFVATLSFETLPAETTFRKLANGSLSVFLEAHRPEKMAQTQHQLALQRTLLELEKVEVLRGTPDSPESDYRLTLGLWLPNGDDASRLRLEPARASEIVRSHFGAAVELDLLRLGDVAVTPELSAKNNKVVLDVTVHATAGTRRIWLTQPALFFGAVPLADENMVAPLGFQLFILAGVVIYLGSWVAVLASVIVTSFFIPNMLRKGTVDLLLVKPLHRWTLLLYKYVGGLTFIFLNTAYAIVGIYLVLGLRSGIFAHYSLLLVFGITFFFAILYSIATLVGVLTRSIITSILVTCGAWLVFWGAGTAQRFIEQKDRMEQARHVPQDQRISSKPVAGVIRTIHAVLPRTSDLEQFDNLVLVSDFMTGSLADAHRFAANDLNWWESAGVSGAFIAVMLALACWAFTVKDY